MCLLGSYQREFFGGVTEDAILLGFRGFGQSGALIAREYLEPVSESGKLPLCRQPRAIHHSVSVGIYSRVSAGGIQG
jgi:hypothetical protein